MTLPEAGEIFAYWAHNPPPHLMLQAIARSLGWKPIAQAPPALADIEAMAAPGLAVRHDGDIGMPPPTFDVDLLRARNSALVANRRAKM